MKTQNETNTAVMAPRAGRRWLIAAALALAAGAGGASFAIGAQGLPGPHGHAGHMAMDPAAMDAHIDKMVEQIAADASPDQKARVAAIAKSAMADLRPVHEQFRQAHASAHQLLMAPVVDRAALEQLRVEQMQRMDFMSRRVLAAVEDAADVLTPEQRAKFAGHLRSRIH
ncbi:periplasmic heavy metal sensor [Massilia sp. R2A-15]|uniref:periplasmic heavy metal sensor n=1 Tax=Massilia sp. R2A-15 TaxID=3064278 RepID=UPI002732CF93|nr:periplasmic heavy metal sensor [Massilia sp. R2A-15]WLI89443.1 periplasmic heavy metal sensor [Massilia sp. R2A-15]